MQHLYIPVYVRLSISVRKQSAIKINVGNEKIKLNTFSKKEIDIKMGGEKTLTN